MGHATSKNYLNLQKRLDMSVQGTPASETLFKILRVLFTEKDAKLVSLLPLKPFTVKKAAKVWKMSAQKARKILNDLADKGLLFDMRYGKTQTYLVPPSMAGFFEFSLMRTDGMFDRKVLSELFYQYINVEDRFVHEVFGIKPHIDRTFIHEDTIQPKHKSEILDYERASKVIDTATCITVGDCYCRHKMQHKGKACKMPMKVCLAFNNPAKSLAKHGIAKEISKKQAKKILDKCVKLGLVQIGDNVQDGVGWICNCCSCCCEAIQAYNRLGYMDISSNFYAKNTGRCTGCGLCVKKCPVDAIKLKAKNAIIDSHKCIGCGVCTKACNFDSLVMERRKKTKFVPKDSFERFVLNAINEGKLQNFIFDNFDLWTNDVLRGFISVILKLKPVKALLASKQLRSRYLKALVKANLKSQGKMYTPKMIDYSHPELKKKKVKKTNKTKPKKHKN